MPIFLLAMRPPVLSAAAATGGACLDSVTAALIA